VSISGMGLPSMISGGGTNQKTPEGIQDMLSGMGSKIDSGIAKVAGWFDKSQMRQYAFALIVMPLITAIAMRILLGGSFFQHGFAALSNPGTMQIMGLPIVTILAAVTGYGIVSLFTKDLSEKKQNTIKRLMRLAALPIYAATYLIFIGYLFKLQGGVAHASYVNPPTAAGGGAFPSNFAASSAGLLTTAWPLLLIYGALPIPYFFDMFFHEIDAISAETNRHMHLAEGKSLKEQLAMQKRQGELYAERQEKIRIAKEAEAARVRIEA